MFVQVEITFEYSTGPCLINIRKVVYVYKKDDGTSRIVCEGDEILDSPTKYEELRSILCET